MGKRPGSNIKTDMGNVKPARVKERGWWLSAILFLYVPYDSIKQSHFLFQRTVERLDFFHYHLGMNSGDTLGKFPLHFSIFREMHDDIKWNYPLIFSFLSIKWYVCWLVHISFLLWQGHTLMQMWP